MRQENLRLSSSSAATRRRCACCGDPPHRNASTYLKPAEARLTTPERISIKVCLPYLPERLRILWNPRRSQGCAIHRTANQVSADLAPRITFATKMRQESG